MLTEAQGQVYLTVLLFRPLIYLFIGCLLFLAFLFVLSSVHFAVILFLLPFCMSRPFLFAWRITASLVLERNGFSGEVLL
jgi:hypothetical protein